MYGIRFSADPQYVQADALADCRRGLTTLEEQIGPGNEFLGWLDLPSRMEHHEEIGSIAGFFRGLDDVVVIGIGGSYLGFRAVLSALENPLRPARPRIHFAGHHLASGYLKDLLDYLENRSFGVVVISKSGTTTEPAVAFRFLYDRLHRQYGLEGIRHRVAVITDEKKGTLRQLATDLGLKSAVVPDDVGGRFSVFSPVGILPLAIAGMDVTALLAGAKEAMLHIREKRTPEKNPALAYAAYRHSSYRNGKGIELLASYRPELHYVAEWWKQLFGESEGKQGRGIFPASVDLTTDLHSMGQWLQEGERRIFETVIDVEHDQPLKLFATEDDGDGLNYLEGRELNEVNRIALRATLEAHRAGGVPCAVFSVPELNPEHVGSFLYTLEYACGISGYALGVNPFDQPGVEAYKKNMFRMLGKPGS